MPDPARHRSASRILRGSLRRLDCVPIDDLATATDRRRCGSRRPSLLHRIVYWTDTILVRQRRRAGVIADFSSPAIVVEITGTIRPAETTAGGKPTGGATSGPPPAGLDVTSKDLKLRELEVSSVSAATGRCPAK
jgi:hypothetical protein